MNSSFPRIFSALLVLTLGLLTGCAGMQQLPDGTYLSITTVKDSLDRSASHIGIYQKVKGKDGKETYQLTEKGQLSVGATVAGQVLGGATAGVGAAYVQGEALKDATRLGKCADGANCGNVFNVQGGDAASGSTSSSVNHTRVNSAVTVGGGTRPPPCASSGCTGK